jgi:phenylpropionate dioxygenase-like ring-hydroxylating dioxygenase large terminal subunit
MGSSEETVCPTSGIAPDWTQTLIDPHAFRDEQRRLEHVWTFLGLRDDLAHDGDWFRASIATRPVFVQRFGDELRGFDNLCVHRFHPLRQEAKGNGPVICGFHHWHYNRDGRAVGIPACNAVYGKAPHDMGARLRELELATCGQMIFGRFPTPRATQSLKDFLGEIFPILEAIVPKEERRLYVERSIRANWRLNFHITLEEYHGPVVHPKTFGRFGLPPSLERYQYFRLGAHSAYMDSSDVSCFEHLLEGCRRGTYRSSHYFVIQILPDLIVAHAKADSSFWFCNILQYSPAAHNQTAFRGWLWPAPFESDLPMIERVTRPLTDVFRRHIYRHYFKQIINQDAVICERIQEIAHHIEGIPILGVLEQRIGWFEETIRNLTSETAPQ